MISFHNFALRTETGWATNKLEMSLIDLRPNEICLIKKLSIKKSKDWPLTF